MAKPLYIIDSMQRPLFDPAQRPQEFAWLLDEKYEYEGRLYFADIYRLKDTD